LMNTKDVPGGERACAHSPTAKRLRPAAALARARRLGSEVAFTAILFHLLAIPALAHIPIPPKKGEKGRVVTNKNIPDFTMTDQEGKPFQFAKLEGKVTLLSFVYTTCPDVCPLFTAKMAQIQRTMSEKQKDGYFLLSITTDPEVDSPKVLKAYGKRYNVDFNTWAFLTGTEQQLRPVWSSFGVSVVQRARGLVAHTTLTTLVDRKGRQRFNYYGDHWQENQVLRDISTLLTEK
jgi:protein SCO1